MHKEWRLTRKADGADVTNVDEVAMTEAGGPVVDLHVGWQRHLLPNLSIRQEYALNTRNQKSQTISMQAYLLNSRFY